jgi:hypothetical protein
MAKRQQHTDRAVHIQLLRARAALEREALVESVVQVGESLRPSSLLHSVWPKMRAAGGSRTALQAFTLLRRYPMVASSLSALVMGKGRGLKLLKLGGIAWAAVQMLSAWRKSSARHDAEVGRAQGRERRP